MPTKFAEPSALLLSAVALTLALLFAATQATVKTPADAAPRPEAPASNADDEPLYVERSSLLPGLREVLKTAGDRMERPGKERLVMACTLARGGVSQSSPAALTLEFPGRLRLEEQSGGQARVVTFDGQGAAVIGGAALGRADEDLIETLVYDSVEHFFVGQVRGAATRPLGPNFQSEGDLAAGGDGGPSYDVYELTETVRVGGEPRERVKLYYFNSDTRLLEKVQYQVQRDGAEVRVEVRLGGWHTVQGQKLPASVVRVENNFPVLAIAVTSTAIAPRADDRIFGNQ